VASTGFSVVPSSAGWAKGVVASDGSGRNDASERVEGEREETEYGADESKAGDEDEEEEEEGDEVGEGDEREGDEAEAVASGRGAEERWG
jgi:hypothetical protein